MFHEEKKRGVTYLYTRHETRDRGEIGRGGGEEGWDGRAFSARMCMWWYRAGSRVRAGKFHSHWRIRTDDARKGVFYTTSFSTETCTAIHKGWGLSLVLGSDGGGASTIANTPPKYCRDILRVGMHDLWLSSKYECGQFPSGRVCVCVFLPPHCCHRGPVCRRSPKLSCQGELLSALPGGDRLRAEAFRAQPTHS